MLFYDLFLGYYGSNNSANCGNYGGSYSANNGANNNAPDWWG